MGSNCKLGSCASERGFLLRHSLLYRLRRLQPQGIRDRREYTLQGQVLSVQPDQKQAVIRHEEIKGFMPAMTMPYYVQDTKEYRGLTAGDLITAKLVVEPTKAYLEQVKKVGNAPLDAADGGSRRRRHPVSS